MTYKIKNILSEQSFSGKKGKQLIDAIKGRHPVTFYYTGPKSPEKDRVKPGVRIRAEVVAMGLSKKGNVIVRAYVQPPSVSKKGYDKTNWRTFIVDRMSNINILQDEVFDTQRPGYKEGSESDRGPMVTTYVTSDWTSTPDVKTKETPPPTPKPKVKPTKEPLPEPKVDTKPTPTPELKPKDNIGDVAKNITPKEINGEKYLTTQEYETLVKDLYRRIENDWKDSQKSINKNTIPGEGTRKRFEIQSNRELSDLLKKDNIKVVTNLPQPTEDIEVGDLQETISRIKSLILLIN